jgi:metal-responsive CopG/Arc/MetJ family transcriptional regulator
VTRNILSVQLPASLSESLDTVCGRTLIPRSAFVRRAIENALDPKTGIEAQLMIAAELAQETAQQKADRA